MTMRIVCRADASLQMGSGHVMRCLTLADALNAKGADCHFISREHPGHLLEVIHQRFYKANRLVANVQPARAAIKNIVKESSSPQQKSAHAAWLGSAWQTDAQETAVIMSNLQSDACRGPLRLDQRWEDALAPHYRKLLVIDDLADRPHRCELLLDQNLGRQPQDYPSFVTCYAFPILRAIRITSEGRVEMFNAEYFNTRSQDLEEACQFYQGRTAAWLQGQIIFSPAAASSSFCSGSGRRTSARPQTRPGPNGCAMPWKLTAHPTHKRLPNSPRPKLLTTFILYAIVLRANNCSTFVCKLLRRQLQNDNE